MNPSDTPRPTEPPWLRSAAAGLTFRPIADEDAAFLRAVYASTRQAELALVDWPPEQKAAFVEMQFAAQHAHYSRHYPGMAWLVVTVDGEDAGRLYLDRRPSEHAIVDIAFLSGHRGRGHGQALLSDILDEAAAIGKAVSIHVEKFNPALRLYRRLGFATVEDEGIYDLMRWTAQPNTAS